MDPASWEKSKGVPPLPLYPNATFFFCYYYKSNICFFRKCSAGKNEKKIKSICNLIRVIVDNILECVCFWFLFSYAYIFV